MQKGFNMFPSTKGEKSDESGTLERKFHCVAHRGPLKAIAVFGISDAAVRNRNVTPDRMLEEDRADRRDASTAGESSMEVMVKRWKRRYHSFRRWLPLSLTMSRQIIRFVKLNIIVHFQVPPVALRGVRKQRIIS